MKIRLHGAKNVREFSEYGLAGEGYIRAAHLQKLTKRDMVRLTERYRLRTVIDLRTTKEKEEKPDAVIPGVRYLHIPVFDGEIPGISHTAEEDTADALLNKIPDMPALYRALVTEDACVAQLRRALAVIFDPDREGAVLWHCTEGKDRCGILTALVLLRSGVSREAVLRDYLKTNRVNFPKAWKYDLLIRLSGRGNKCASLVRDAFLARRRYLEPILDRLAELAQTDLC